MSDARRGGGMLPPVNRPLAGGLAPRAGEGWRGRSAAAVATAWIFEFFWALTLMGKALNAIAIAAMKKRTLYSKAICPIPDDHWGACGTGVGGP